MKLQNLIIIFIIIIIPIVLIFSYYLNLEANTISMQTNYDVKLMEATKEAMEAFSVNTTEWNSEYNTLANTKRRNILSSINTFTTGLSNKLGIGGTAKENILNYVPAIVYIMYDGYYIYTPTYVPESYVNNEGVQYFYYKDAQNDYKEVAEPTQIINGVRVAGEPMYKASSGGTTTNIADAKKIYKHVLKTFVPYTKQYERYGNNYIVNYSLDNFVRIYANYGFGENVVKEGYILEDYNIPEQGSDEELRENIAIKDSYGNVNVEEYSYVYNSNGEKRYYDSVRQRFFSVSKDNVRQDLLDASVGDSFAEYKKVLLPDPFDQTKYKSYYQLLNTISGGYARDNNWYTGTDSLAEIIEGPPIEIDKDCSAFNYYVEAYCFNKWLDNNLGPNERLNILNNKENNIIENINNNLNLSITNYSANSSLNYKLPKISENDWEQALSNISIITFMQGMKTGLKTYNNYSIVTSTENNEFVSEDSIYYLDNGNQFYHRFGCSEATGGIKGAYKNTDFKLQTYYDKNNDLQYYYKHTNGNNPLKECFNCIVNRNKINTLNENELNNSNFNLIKTVALARERYILMERTRILKNND